MMYATVYMGKEIMEQLNYPGKEELTTNHDKDKTKAEAKEAELKLEKKFNDAISAHFGSLVQQYITLKGDPSINPESLVKNHTKDKWIKNVLDDSKSNFTLDLDNKSSRQVIKGVLNEIIGYLKSPVFTEKDKLLKADLLDKDLVALASVLNSLDGATKSERKEIRDNLNLNRIEWVGVKRSIGGIDNLGTDIIDNGTVINTVFADTKKQLPADATIVSYDRNFGNDATSNPYTIKVKLQNGKVGDLPVDGNFKIPAGEHKIGSGADESILKTDGTSVLSEKLKATKATVDAYLSGLGGFKLSGNLNTDGAGYKGDIENADGSIKYIGVTFDGDGKIIDNQKVTKAGAQVTIKVDGNAIVEAKDAPTPGVDKPEDDSFVEITVENDKKPILDLLTGVSITDGKLFRSPASGNIAFYKITGKADGEDFTLYLDKDKKLQSEDGDNLIPTGTDPVENGEYTFTQGVDNKILVAKKVDEEKEDAPEDLSTRTIDQIKEASPEAIVGRLGKLIEKLTSDNISYIPGRRGPRTNNPDIAWVQKGLIEYAKKNPEFSIRDSGDRDGRKWSADGTEFKFTGGSAPDGFIEDDFVSGEYDKGFAGSVASFQTLDESAGKQDGLPGKKTLTALQSALSPETIGGGG